MNAARWHTCTDPDEMLAFLADEITPRLVRRFALACHRWLMPNPSPVDQEALTAAERYADHPTEGEEWCSELTGGHFSTETTWDNRAHATCLRWRPGFYVRASGRDLVGLRPEERGAICQLLRDVVGDPFAPVDFETAWLLHDEYRVPKLARAIYAEESFADLPVLADALLDAGCQNAALLEHLRAPGPHVRGCWALDRCMGWRLVSPAIRDGDTALLSTLLPSGADLAFFRQVLESHCGEVSPLYLAIQHGQLAVVELLLAAGADPRGLDDPPESPLNVAVEHGHLDIVHTLLAAGAQTTDGMLCPPLVHACMYSHLAVAKALLEAGAEVDAVEEEGYTSLLIAVQLGNLDLVRLLAQAGADLGHQNRQGQTPLLAAMQFAGVSNNPFRDEVVNYLRARCTSEQVREAEKAWRMYQEATGSVD